MASSPVAERIPAFLHQRRDVWVLSMLCLGMAALAILPVLTTALAFAPSHDTPHLTTPLFCEIGRHFSAGRFPLFDWTTLEPVSHNAHFSPLYPFYLPGILNYCDLLQSVGAHDLVTVLHLAIMTVNVLVLARVAGLPAMGAIFATFVIVFSMDTMAVARWPTLIAPASWLPLAAAGLLAVLYRDQWARGVAMVVAGAGMMLLGAPATNLMASLVVFGIAATIGALVVTFRAGTWRWKPLVWAACGIVSAVLIALIAVGTTGNLLIALDDLIRWNRTGYVVGRQVTGDFAREILFEQQGARELLSVILPFRVPFLATGSFFLGGITACLAALGAWDGRRDALTRAMAVMIAVILVVMYLDHFELAMLWSRIPGLNHTRHLSLLGGPFIIAAGLLAGRGFLVVLRPEAIRARRVLAGTLLTLALLSPPFLLLATNFSWRLAGPAVLGMAILALVLRRLGDGFAAKNPGSLAALMALSTGLVVLPNLYFHLRSIAESPARTATWTDLSRMAERLAAADPEPSVFTLHDSITGDDFQYTIAGTSVRILGLPAFQYFHSPRVYWKFFAQNYLFPDFATYGLLGGRYVLTQGALDHPLLEPIGSEGSIFAYRIRGARQLVTPICGVPRLPAEHLVGGPRLRRSQLALAPPPLLAAARAADVAPPACGPAPVSEIRIDRSVESLRFTMAPVGAEFLVLNLPPYEGWRLTVGGRRLPLFALDDSRMVAALPPGLAGPSALSFKPTPVWARMAISAATGGVLAVFFIWLAWRRPGPDRPIVLPARMSFVLGGSTKLSTFLQTRGLRFAARPPRPNS